MKCNKCGRTGFTEAELAAHTALPKGCPPVIQSDRSNEPKKD